MVAEEAEDEVKKDYRELTCEEREISEGFSGGVKYCRDIARHVVQGN